MVGGAEKVVITIKFTIRNGMRNNGELLATRRCVIDIGMSLECGVMAIHNTSPLRIKIARCAIFEMAWDWCRSCHRLYRKSLFLRGVLAVLQEESLDVVVEIDRSSG